MLSNVGRGFRVGAKVILSGLLGAAAITVGCSSPNPGEPSGAGGQAGSGGGGAGAGGEAGGAATSEWTEFKESADTQKIYVSSASGDDLNDGSSPEKAVKTIAKGKSLLRDGKPDWMLLERGNVWLEGLGEWKTSGRSSTERMVITSYGDSEMRPTLKTGSSSALTAFVGPIRYVAFVGMHFFAHSRDPSGMDFTGISGSPGIQWAATTDDLLIEDVVVQSYSTSNITIQGSIINFKLRRSIIVDSYANNGPSQGMYMEGVKGALIEENLFDHNGWNDHPNLSASPAPATIFNHNVYIQPSCNDVTFRGNITARASSHGLQARAGGIVRDNLVVDNPIGISYGLALAEWDPKAGGVTGEVSGNFVRDSGDVDAANSGGIGIQLANIKSVVVDGNILAHDDSAQATGVAIEVTRKTNPLADEKIEGLTIQNNVIYDWRGGIRFSTSALGGIVLTNNEVQAPLRATELVNYFGQGFSSSTSYGGSRWFSIAPAGAWFTLGATGQSFDQWLVSSGETGATNTLVAYVDPERQVGTYHETLGKEATIEAYLAEVRKQSSKNWRIEYMAKSPIEYLRQGFGK